MRPVPSILAALAFVVFPVSCSVPGTAVMGELHEGMSREQVASVMQSKGMKPEDRRQRPAGGWATHGQDPFAAGVMAGEFEGRTGQRVEWAEVYYIPGERGASVINLYYDGAGKLLR